MSFEHKHALQAFHRTDDKREIQVLHETTLAGNAHRTREAAANPNRKHKEIDVQRWNAIEDARDARNARAAIKTNQGDIPKGAADGRVASPTSRVIICI